MERVAIVPGSFDPVTLGHLDIITRAARLFDRVIAVVMVNEKKQYLFPLEKRRMLLTDAVRSLPRVCVGQWSGMLYEFAAENNACAIVKGIRDEDDLLYEQQMADFNDRRCCAQTVLLPARAQLKNVSSSYIKACMQEGQNISELVTPLVLQELQKIYTLDKAKQKGSGDTHGGKCD